MSDTQSQPTKTQPPATKTPSSSVVPSASAASPAQQIEQQFAPPAAEPTPPAKAAVTKNDWRLIAAVSIGAAVILILLIAFVAFLAADPLRTANIRDIVIILFGLVAIVMMVVLGVLLTVVSWQMQMLLYLLRNEIKPLLININETVAHVRGTTLLVTENVTQPTIKAAKFVAGVRGVGRAFRTRVTGGPATPSAGAGPSPNSSATP